MCVLLFFALFALFGCAIRISLIFSRSSMGRGTGDERVGARARRPTGPDAPSRDAPTRVERRRGGDGGDDGDGER